MLPSIFGWNIWFVVFLPSEWEMPPPDWAWDSEAEGAGWRAQSGAEGLEGEASAQEEGIRFHFIHHFKYE